MVHHIYTALNWAESEAIMANKITAQAVGGQPKVLDNVETVGDLKEQMNLSSYQATVNGEAADDDYELSDYEFVSLAPKVKGA